MQSRLGSTCTPSLAACKVSECVYADVFVCVRVCLTLCVRVCACVCVRVYGWVRVGERVGLCEAHDDDAREGDNVAVEVWVHMHAQFGCFARRVRVCMRMSLCVYGCVSLCIRALCVPACACVCACRWVGLSGRAGPPV